MGKHKIVSVADHQNKTDVKKIRLEKKACQKLLNSTSFVKFCIEKNTTTCDAKNLPKFNKFSRLGW